MNLFLIILPEHLRSFLVRIRCPTQTPIILPRCWLTTQYRMLVYSVHQWNLSLTRLLLSSLLSVQGGVCYPANHPSFGRKQKEDNRNVGRQLKSSLSLVLLSCSQHHSTGQGSSVCVKAWAIFSVAEGHICQHCFPISQPVILFRKEILIWEGSPVLPSELDPSHFGKSRCNRVD